MAISTRSSKDLRAIVCVPPLYDFYFTPHRFSSLGAKIVSNILISKNIPTELLVFPKIGKKGKNIDLPPNLSYLTPHIISNEVGKCSFFTQYKHFGPEIDNSAKIIAQHNANVLFISLFAFCYADSAIELSIAVKKLLPNIKIVLGGAGATVFPKYFFESQNIKIGAIDFVLAGEAESNLGNFIDEMRKPNPNYLSVKGLYFYDTQNDKLQYTEFFEPTTSKSIELSFDLYKTKKRNPNILSICVSRGCGMNCTYCSTKICHGNSFRSVNFSSLENLTSSILINENAENEPVLVNFEDDNLLWDKEYLFKILDYFKENFNVTGFLMENGIDFRLLDSNTILRLFSFGLKNFNLSIGSVEENILKRQNRLQSLDKFIKVLNNIKINGGSATTYFIVGLEGETKNSIVRTLKFLSKYPTMLGISMFYAIPQIHGFLNLKPKEIIPAQMCGSSAFPWTKSVSTKTLITAFRLTRYINLTKSDYKTDLDNLLIEKIITTKKLHTIVKTNNELKIIKVPNQDEALVSLFFESN